MEKAKKKSETDESKEIRSALIESLELQMEKLQKLNKSEDSQ